MPIGGVAAVADGERLLSMAVWSFVVTNNPLLFSDCRLYNPSLPEESLECPSAWAVWDDPAVLGKRAEWGEASDVE